MPAAAITAAPLRLVNTDASAPPRVLPAHIMRPPDEAPATDPRWVLAVAVTRGLEGGRAAILRPESRERITGLARDLGLRSFDAALIIAIVQDAARRGEPLGGETAARLQCVRGGGVSAQPSVSALLLISLSLGAWIFAGLALLVG